MSVCHHRLRVGYESLGSDQHISWPTTFRNADNARQAKTTVDFD